MKLVRPLSFMDLLSLELIKGSKKSDSPTVSVDNVNSSGKKIKKSNPQYCLKIVKCRSPHLLEVQDGYYLLTHCDLHTIPEDKEVSIPISSQLYCSTPVR